MDAFAAKRCIEEGRAVLGVEFGSTRIKAVLIGDDGAPVASGGYAWENRYEDGVWTYHLDDVWTGLAACYAALKDDVRARFDAPITRLAGMGVSAMMHGYLAFDGAGNQLAPFRTWRNTITSQAAERLTARFGFNIPQRWSVAHLYQAILNGEPHVREIASLTTLSGYVHARLTDQYVLGVGDAAGMFPIDSDTLDYDARMLALFDELTAGDCFPWTLSAILPRVLPAGADAGALTPEGARLLDPSGALLPGVPFCPPEGDAGTGMTATNSVAARTGNVSAGTSIFAMAVLEHPLSRVYPEIDMVTTPAGRPVAMVHCNNCTTELDAWIRLFGEAARLLGADADTGALFSALYAKATEGEADCGGLVSFNYCAGEHITRIENGRPLFLRTPESRFTLANFMRAQMDACLATLRIGMDILFESEHVALDELYGHGGFFKVKGVGQPLLAAALNVPVSVMETAGEGGAWGIALLAAYRVRRQEGESLEAYLAKHVFAASPGTRVAPDAEAVAGFAAFLARYKRCLAVEERASAAL